VPIDRREADVKKYCIYAGLVAAGALAVATGSSVLAQNGGRSNHVTAILNGFQEGPSIVTTGNGTLDLRIDTEANTIDYELTYSDLEGGPASAAHIHIGSRAENGGVSAFLCGGSKPPCPGASGTISGVITPADVVGPAVQGVEPGSFAELVQAIRAGHTYANVHNARWPGGEIRGQINNDSQRQFDR
jgi:hypothetical protein